MYISEYITADYPLPAWEYALRRAVAGGLYNRHYLTELGDRSRLRVYFDDCLTPEGTGTVIFEKDYPAG